MTNKFSQMLSRFLPGGDKRQSASDSRNNDCFNNRDNFLRPLFQSSNLSFGPQVQSAGKMSVLPLCSNDCAGVWTSPYSGLKFGGVQGYGHVTFNNDGDGTAILPMHMGYIQKGAQNHAISAAALLAKGQSRKFDNARCVQAAQGGYLKSQEQWFFILPLKLREEMLAKRNIVSCSVLWNAIGRLGLEFGSSGRGHLDDIIQKKRAELNEYGKQFELIHNQRGAVFFIDDSPVGIEIGPSAVYFADIWNSLVCFCYGTAAMIAEQNSAANVEPIVREATVDVTRKKLRIRREMSLNRLKDAFAKLDWTPQEFTEEECLMNLRLYTFRSSSFYGQIVRRNNELIYASMFRTGIGI